jgi:hypothetical protein
MSSPTPDASSFGAINHTISGTAAHLAGGRSLLDPSLDAIKGRCDWFVEALTSDGQRRLCTKKEFKKVLREDILAGLLKADDEVRIHTKRKDGRWEDTTAALRGFALHHHRLRIVYEPVWTHALNGFLWGASAGIGFVILNALILASMQGPRVAICFAAGLLALLIPRVGRTIAKVIFFVSGLMGYGGILGSVLAMAVWAILLGLTGMMIGGAIGWVREEKLPRAPDVPAEGGAIVVKALVLPLIGSLLAWGVFIFVVYPWAVRVVGISPFSLLGQ